jgi:hypothetical protein
MKFYSSIMYFVLRMVLEPKSGAQCDYGSFEDTRPLNGDVVAVGAEEVVIEGNGVVPGAEESGADGFLSQQPLLLGHTDQEWAKKFPAPSPRRPNGAVKIDIPPPALREKSHFPQEKLKTLLGNYDFFF